MNNRKKASYGMKKMRGGDYMEPNKELKFGTPKGKKPKRRRAGDGDTVQEEKPFLERAGEKWSTIKKNMKNYGKNSSYGQSDAAKARKANVQSNKAAKGNAAAGAGAARRRQLQEETTRNSPNPPASMDPKKGTYVGSQAEKDMKKNPYSEAKKRDANLDSYIKQRNAAEKGSLDYNEAQNKINKAYGKGPTNRRTTYGPEKKGENITQLNKRGPAKMDSNAPKPTLQTKMISTKTPTPADSGIKDRRAKGKEKKQPTRRQQGRAAKARSKEFTKDKEGFSGKMRRTAARTAKAIYMDDKDKAKKSAEAFGKAKAKQETKSKIKAIKEEGKADIKAARKMEKGGPRKKAFLGVAKNIANVVSKLAPEGSAVGNLANTASAVMDNPIQAGINAIKGQPITGGQQQQPATPAAPAANPQPTAGATGQPVQQQTMKRGGKKKKALKDRRKRGRGR